MRIKYITLGLGFFCLLLFSYSSSQAHSEKSMNDENIIAAGNLDRKELGLAPLKENQDLDLAANLKLADMQKHFYFAHISPLGKTPWYFLRRAGYDFKSAGENLAKNYYGPADLEAAWMKSPEHRANILNPEFTEIGVAEKQILYQGQTTNFVVEYLGTR